MKRGFGLDDELETATQSNHQTLKLLKNRFALATNNKIEIDQQIRY